MKEYCTGRILFGTLAIGTGLLLADAASADKGEVKGQNNQAAAKRAGRTKVNVTSNKKQAQTAHAGAAHKPVSAAKQARQYAKAHPSEGIAGGACPNPDHGCFQSGTPGCSDETCCDTVCACDPFCCSVAWDIYCAGAGYVPGCGAAVLCDAPPVLNDNCDDRLPIGLGDTSFSTIGATTDGPTTTCNGFSDPQINQDIWYNFVAGADDLFTVSLCNGTGYDSKLAVYDGCSCPAGAELVCNDDTCGLVSQVTFTAVSGNCYKIRVGGYQTNIGSGVITITQGAPPAICPNPDHDCASTGTPGCSDEACCNTICALDPFCCSAAWDGICVSEANTFCGGGCEQDCPGGAYLEAEACGDDTNGGCNVPAGGASGNCCVANGGIGCEDAACQAAVCAFDAFCCSTAWDSICASEAFATPPCDCSLGSPGYEAISCGTTVCGTEWADGNTRDTDWYSFSLTAAADVTLKAWAQFPSVTFILNDNCAAITVLAQSTAGQCPQIACAHLDAGNYVAFVAPAAFAGNPCGSGLNNYVFTLSCSGCDGDVTPLTGVVDVDDLFFIINHWGACP